VTGELDQQGLDRKNVSFKKRGEKACLVADEKAGLGTGGKHPWYPPGGGVSLPLEGGGAWVGPHRGRGERTFTDTIPLREKSVHSTCGGKTCLVLKKGGPRESTGGKNRKKKRNQVETNMKGGGRESTLRLVKKGQ